MLKSCQYCGRIHDEKYICDQKKEHNKQQQANRRHTDTYETHRKSTYWKKLSKWIKERDLYICQICGKQANEVHHIIKIEEDTSKAYEETNLISLCHNCHIRAEKGQINKQLLFDKVKQSIDKYNERMGY